ncbi:conserved hypothetical protein [Candidatus Magnetomoraceae bacterium gMMP-15]
MSEDYTVNITKAAQKIIFKDGYAAYEILIRDWALLTALSKIEKYKAECDFFEHKYKMKIENFEKILHIKKGSENFEKEEDLEDWEFALSALEWWEKKAYH